MQFQTFDVGNSSENLGVMRMAFGSEQKIREQSVRTIMQQEEQSLNSQRTGPVNFLLNMKQLR